jgi:hypothetical protein
MRLPLSLTRILGAVIVLIAVYAMPSTAFAHQGHEAVVSTTASATAAAEVSAAPHEMAVIAGKPGSDRASGQLSRQATDNAPCSGGCCSAGSSCCVPAIGNSSAHLERGDRGKVLVAAAAAVFGGVDPNLFGRPPRFFA